mgnify:CR=1 FL=1
MCFIAKSERRCRYLGCLFNVELIAVASVVNTFDIAFVVTFNVGFAVGLAVVIVAFVERGAFLSGGSVVATIQIAVFVAGFVGVAFVFTQQVSART